MTLSSDERLAMWRNRSRTYCSVGMRGCRSLSYSSCPAVVSHRLRLMDMLSTIRLAVFHCVGSPPLCTYLARLGYRSLPAHTSLFSFSARGLIPVTYNKLLCPPSKPILLFFSQSKSLSAFSRDVPYSILLLSNFSKKEPFIKLLLRKKRCPY